ncbi:DUF418 domain-containing protein [Nonomuraea sp. SYSU D8015]|uniref:DUF418 domain-containing protein n=1 Tax=Nonomuraea sp. SYSU D8015 TaxID=2593644 RepID=UPI001CB718B4
MRAHATRRRHPTACRRPFRASPRAAGPRDGTDRLPGRDGPRPADRPLLGASPDGWSTTTVLLFSGGVLAVQWVWSTLWLRRYRQGPPEWLWRWARRPAPAGVLTDRQDAPGKAVAVPKPISKGSRP